MPRMLRIGARGEDVTRLQILLNALLIPSPRLSLDGQFGEVTRAAVRRFQQERQLAVDGIVGSESWDTLMGLLAPSRPVTSLVVAPWLDIARAETGVRERSGKEQHEQRIVEYHATTTLGATDDETPWCSSFVNWVMMQAGHRGTNSAAARSWLDWGRSLDEPRPGAVTVIKRRGQSSDAATGSASGFHVAFFVAADACSLTLLGGNQANRVRESTYPLERYDVRGHRWPG